LSDSGGPSATISSTLERAGTVVVAIVGEVDMSNAELVRAEIDRLVHEAAAVVFDVAGLEFMDSSGIAALLQVAARFDSVVVRNPSTIIRRVIEAAGITEVLKLEP